MTGVVLIATCLAFCVETVHATAGDNNITINATTTSTNTTTTTTTSTTTTMTTTTNATTSTNTTTTTTSTTTTTTTTTTPPTTTTNTTTTAAAINNNNSSNQTAPQPSPSPTPALTEGNGVKKNTISQELTIATLPANSAAFLKSYSDSLSTATGVSTDKIAKAKIDSMKILVSAKFTETIKADDAKKGFAAAASVQPADVEIAVTRRLKGSQDSDDYALDASSAHEYMTLDDYADVEEKRRASSGVRQRVPESDVKIVAGRRARASLRQLASTITATITVKEGTGKDIVQRAKEIHTAVNNATHLAAKISDESGTTVTAPTIETKFIVSVSAEVYSKKALPTMAAINDAMGKQMGAQIIGSNSADADNQPGTSSRAFSGCIHVAFLACVLVTLASRLGL